jgi:ATP-dependent RNA helicase RhlE
LSGFKDGSVRVLVATDIAARGIDIAQLPQVVNYELPNIAEDYVHRIGRTGRAGMEGHAISLVSADEQPLLVDVEKLIQQILPREEFDGFKPQTPVAMTTEAQLTRPVKKPKKPKVFEGDRSDEPRQPRSPRSSQGGEQRKANNPHMGQPRAHQARQSEGAAKPASPTRSGTQRAGQPARSPHAPAGRPQGNRSAAGGQRNSKPQH